MPNEKVLHVVKALYTDINKFHEEISIIQSREDMESLCDVLFSYAARPCAKYGIRFLFNYKHYVQIIMNKANDIFKTKYDIINFFIIDYYGREDFKIYKDIKTIHEFNLKLLNSIGYFYEDIPRIPIIYNIIYMCNSFDDIKQLFLANDSLWSPALKHMIYTKNISCINRIIRQLTQNNIPKVINILKEKYNKKQMYAYNYDVHEFRRLTGGISCYSNPAAYHGVLYLYECMLQLLEYETVTYLFESKIQLNDLRFFESCCNYILKNFDFKGKRISLDQHRARLIFGDNYKCLIKILSKKCLTKYMEKFGAYDKSDNLNERHLVDLIVTYIV